MPTTTLINLHLNDGSTRQYKSDEPEATYEPGETLELNGRRCTIVRKSQVTVPTALEGDEWQAFCKLGLGAPDTTAASLSTDPPATTVADHATQATAAGRGIEADQ